MVVAERICGDFQKRHGMATLEPKSAERVRDVHINDDTISVDLFDGRTITVPLDVNKTTRIRENNF